MSQWSNGNPPKGVPTFLGQVCGGLAGGKIMWEAASAWTAPSSSVPEAPLSEEDASWQNFVNDEPMSREPHVGGFDPVAHIGLAAIGASAGYALGTRSPAKSVLVLGALVGGHYAHQLLHEKFDALQNELHTVHNDIHAVHMALNDPLPAVDGAPGDLPGGDSIG